MSAATNARSVSQACLAKSSLWMIDSNLTKDAEGEGSTASPHRALPTNQAPSMSASKPIRSMSFFDEAFSKLAPCISDRPCAHESGAPIDKG